MTSQELSYSAHHFFAEDSSRGKCKVNSDLLLKKVNAFISNEEKFFSYECNGTNGKHANSVDSTSSIKLFIYNYLEVKRFKNNC